MEIESLKDEIDNFLEAGRDDGMENIALEQRVTRLVINGHIPLPTTLTGVQEFLGQHNTSSLPLAVLTRPAMAETTGDGRGYPVVKLKPGI